MILIGGGALFTNDPDMPFEADGAVAAENGRIVAAGKTTEMKRAFSGAEFIDAKGGLILPGLINAHTHFYSSLLRGVKLKGFAPDSLFEALAGRAWRLDRRLSFTDCVNAAYAAIIESVHCGVTTLFDHHACADPAGTLGAIAAAAADVGVRVCLACEVSDRGGYACAQSQIRENVEFADYCKRNGGEKLAAMFGLHAPFTLTDATLRKCAAAKPDGVGFHLHMSEGEDDRSYCFRTSGNSPAQRLKTHGVLGPDTLLCHCVRATEKEIALIAESGAFVVNLPQSNMSNGVGFAPVPRMMEAGVTVCIGTDGYTGDMIESARSYTLIRSHEAGLPGRGADEAAKMLFSGNVRLAEKTFGPGLGRIKPGAPADVAVFEYRPFTPIDRENVMNHILFGLSGRSCETVMASGRIIMRGGRLTTVNEAKLRASCAAAASSLLERIEAAGPMPPLMT